MLGRSDDDVPKASLPTKVGRRTQQLRKPILDESKAIGGNAPSRDVNHFNVDGIEDAPKHVFSPMRKHSGIGSGVCHGSVIARASLLVSILVSMVFRDKSAPECRNFNQKQLVAKGEAHGA